MSLFQCEHCGCCENTALSNQGCGEWFAKHMDWSGMPERKGMKLCSACQPAKFSDGEVNDEGGNWHNAFPRVFLPKGQFHTNRVGNLAHNETGDEDFTKYQIAAPEDL